MGYFRDNVEQAEGYTPGFQPKATDVVKLNTNENPYPPSPQVMKTLAEVPFDEEFNLPAKLAADRGEGRLSRRPSPVRSSDVESA